MSTNDFPRNEGGLLAMMSDFHKTYFQDSFVDEPHRPQAQIEEEYDSLTAFFEFMLFVWMIDHLEE